MSTCSACEAVVAVAEPGDSTPQLVDSGREGEQRLGVPSIERHDTPGPPLGATSHLGSMPVSSLDRNHSR